MIPKTVNLLYTDNCSIVGLLPEDDLPVKLHTRPSACDVKVVGQNRQGLNVVFRSAYDVLRDIVLEAFVEGSNASVHSVYFMEAK